MFGWICLDLKNVQFSKCSNIVASFQSLNERFYPFPQIQTEAVLSLDEHIGLTADQVKIQVLRGWVVLSFYFLAW